MLKFLAIVFIACVPVFAGAKVMLDLDYHDSGQRPGVDEFGFPVSRIMRDYSQTGEVYVSLEGGGSSTDVGGAALMRGRSRDISRLSRPGFAAPHNLKKRSQNGRYHGIFGSEPENIAVGVNIPLDKAFTGRGG